MTPQTPPVLKKIKIAKVESPPEADTLDSTLHFSDLVVSNRNKWTVTDDLSPMSDAMSHAKWVIVWQ